MGAHASPLDPSGGPRVHALPRSEFAHDRTPRRGDAASPDFGGSGQGRGRRTGCLAADLPTRRRGRYRGRSDRVGLPARTGESRRGGDGPAGLRPLWRHNPRRLIRDYLEAGLDIVFSSVSAEGLDASWLGRRWDAATIEDLLRLERTRGVHPCGEGGEFETLVLDGPLFHQRVEILRAEPQWSGSAGVWRVLDARLVPKSGPITADAGPAGPSEGP